LPGSASILGPRQRLRLRVPSAQYKRMRLSNGNDSPRFVSSPIFRGAISHLVPEGRQHSSNCAAVLEDHMENQVLSAKTSAFDSAASKRRASSVAPFAHSVPDNEGESHFQGFPVLEALANHPDLVGQAPFRGLRGLLLLHPRPSMLAFCAAAAKLGMEYSAMTALTKQYLYPERVEVLGGLQRMGVHVAPVTRCDDVLAAFADHDGSRDFIVIEDGGRLTHEVYQRPKLLEACRGFIEQTTRGRWVVEDTVATLTRPHLFLPESRIKPALECHDVGEALTEAIAVHFAPRSLSGASVAVLGVCGKIGEAVTKSLRARGAHVYGYDMNPPEYFGLLNNSEFVVCPSKSQAIAGRDIIVGATGRMSIEIGDLHLLTDGVLLCSASSEDVEFPLAVLRQLSHTVVPYNPPGCSVAHGLVFHMRSGKRVVVADEGRPVNLGIAAPPERRACFDLVLALMLAAAIEIARGRYRERIGWITDFDEICRLHGLVELRAYFNREGL
jgi:hypothetical protein